MMTQGGDPWVRLSLFPLRRARSLTLGVAEPSGRDHAGVQGGGGRSVQGIGSRWYLFVSVSSCLSASERSELTLPSQDMGPTAFQETASRARRVDGSGGGAGWRVFLLLLPVHPPADKRINSPSSPSLPCAEVRRRGRKGRSSWLSVLQQEVHLVLPDSRPLAAHSGDKAKGEAGLSEPCRPLESTRLPSRCTSLSLLSCDRLPCIPTSHNPLVEECINAVTSRNRLLFTSLSALVMAWGETGVFYGVWAKADSLSFCAEATSLLRGALHAIDHTILRRRTKTLHVAEGEEPAVVRVPEEVWRLVRMRLIEEVSRWNRDS